MMNTRWSEDAMDELKAIYDFYKKRKGVKAARKFRKKMFDRVGLLKNFPRLGKLAPTPFKNQEIRYLIEGNYRIIYHLKESEIEIIGVSDSRKDPNRYTF